MKRRTLILTIAATLVAEILLIVCLAYAANQLFLYSSPTYRMTKEIEKFVLKDHSDFPKHQMSEAQFWSLMEQVDQDELLKGEGHEDLALEPLIDALSRLPVGKIRAFEDQMSRRLYELDGKKYFDAAGANTSSDSFLYARCFVVARGEQYYKKTLADPSNMPKTMDGWLEPLLFVAADAWAKRTDEASGNWDHGTEFNYETGSNFKAH